MELPPPLRQAVDRALSGRRPVDLAATAAALSQRYREERRDGRFHVASAEDALAYLAVRLPATYAAVRASFAAIKQARPDFAPKFALDIGAGPGTALWAAADCWPGLADVAGRGKPGVSSLRRSARARGFIAAHHLAPCGCRDRGHR